MTTGRHSPLAAYRRILPAFLTLAWMALLIAGAAEAPGPPPSEEDEPRAIPERYESLILPSLRIDRSAAPVLGIARHEASDGPTEGVPFQDLASPEITLDALLPVVGGYDRFPRALGGEGGAVCVIAVEDFVLRALRSTDGGLTFAAEIDVTGGAGAGAVLDYAVDLAADDAVHVALIVAEPNGDRGLRYVRSPDRCQTWDVPVELITDVDPELGVTLARIAAGSTGFVSVAFVGRNGFKPYAVTSANGGSSWTAPVQLDPGNGSALVSTPAVSLDVDAVGNLIHVAYRQDRGTGSQIFTTRSTDDGTTFAAEQDLDAVTPFRGESEQPVIQVVEAGDVLLAYWDVSSGSRMLVATSTDNGQTWTNTHDETVGSNVSRSLPSFCYAPGDTTIQLFWTINDQLWQTKSTNNGGAFTESQVIDATADSDPDGWRSATRIGCGKTGNRAWVVGWSDFRSDSYAGTRTDVSISRSTNDGSDWLPAERADTDAAGAAESRFADLLVTLDGDFFVAWGDRRDAAGREENLYGNVYADGAGFMSQDTRLDANAGTTSASTLQDPAVASDGASGLYVAFSGRGDGHEYDIWVARSINGGYDFDAPVRVSTTPAGQRVQLVPHLAADAGGNVYLAYLADDPISGQREIRFNHSSDFGVTWQVSDEVLDSFSHPVGYFSDSFDFPNVQLRAVGGGLVYVGWSDNVDVFLARSENAGATFTIDDVDQDARGFNRYPAVCAQGDQVVLVTMSPDLAYADFSVWGMVSTDRGANWSSRVQLRSESTFERGVWPVLSCDGTDGALAVWGDLRNGSTWQLFSNRWDGSAWQGDVQLSGPASLDHFWPTVARVGATDVVVAYQDFSGSVYTARSQDNGASFPSHLRLDDVAPDPAALSEAPRITGDGDDLWLFWKDESAGERSIAVRWSRDGGVTWSAVRRVNREQPGGAFPNDYYIVNASAVALSDAAFLTWVGSRDDPAPDVLLNVADLFDADRDTFGAAMDCDDADPAVWAAPVEVSGLVIEQSSDTRLSWNSQDGTAGSATVYDVVTGLLSDLRSTGTFGAATCLAGGLPGTPFDDTRGDPLAGDGDYYLLRAGNPCGISTYGNSSLPADPRNDLDATGPCP